jgi:Tol biopolymer transport system component
VLGSDIYYLDVLSGATERLTRTLDSFDECPHHTPDGGRICYLSTEGFSSESESSFWWSWAKGEYWLMDSDGGNGEQLTHFNTPGYPEYTGCRVLPAYISWNPAGDTILLSIAVECADGSAACTLDDQIYLLDLTK